MVPRYGQDDVVLVTIIPRIDKRKDGRSNRVLYLSL